MREKDHLSGYRLEYTNTTEKLERVVKGCISSFFSSMNWFKSYQDKGRVDSIDGMIDIFYEYEKSGSLNELKKFFPDYLTLNIDVIRELESLIPREIKFALESSEFGKFNTEEDKKKIINALEKMLYEILKEIQDVNFDEIVSFIKSKPQDAKNIRTTLRNVLSLPDSNLSERQKDTLREYLEVYGFDFDEHLESMKSALEIDESEHQRSYEKAQKELALARKIGLLRVAKILDMQGKYRSADRALELARIKY